MAIDDLWVLKDGTTPSKAWGRGLRYRVRVKGWPNKLFRTKKEAETENADRISKGPPKEAVTVTMGELIDRWLETKAGLSKGRRDACRAGSNRVRTRWGKCHPGEVLNSDVQAWLGTMQSVTPGGAHKDDREPQWRPASASTKADALQCLKGALKIAVELKALTRDEAVEITDELGPGKRKPKPMIYLEPAQVRKIAQASGEANETMVWFMAATGVRIGEACRLKVGDVDAKRARARLLETKSRQARDVPIPKFVLNMLDLKRAADAPLFPAPMGGHRRPNDWRPRVFDKAVTAAGFPDLTPHGLRHTAVSWAITANADVKVVQETVGHKSASLTLDTYGHLWAKRLDEVATTVGAMITKELKKADAKSKKQARKAKQQ